jgi:hypothetical protein
MFPTLAVCWVQLWVSLWFAQQVMENVALEPPNFVELLNLIRLHVPWEPTFPVHYYNVRVSTNTPPTTKVVPVTNSTVDVPAVTSTTIHLILRTTVLHISG